MFYPLIKVKEVHHRGLEVIEINKIMYGNNLKGYLDYKRLN